MGLDMLYLKGKNGGSAAGTVAASSESGGSSGGRQGPYTIFMLSRVEYSLKGWGNWSNVCGTAIDGNNVSELVTKIKATLPADVRDKFD